MAEIVVAQPSAGPHTHALVVGVSDYPYVDGPSPSGVGGQSGLSSLTSAARSAADFASWLLRADGYWNPGAPVGSIEIFLSPSVGESIAADVLAVVAGPCPATRDEVEAGLTRFVARCRENTDNVAFIYFAGHGVQVTKHGATVLLEDFGTPDRAAEFYGAIDVTGCHAGLNDPACAGTQFWFVDACRESPAFQWRYSNIAGALTLSSGTAGDVSGTSPLVIASSSQQQAYAAVGGSSLFVEALVELLGGAGAVGPDDTCDDWHVSVHNLIRHLDTSVKLKASVYGATQHVDVTGRVIDGVINQLRGPPDVHCRIVLDPVAAHAVSTASLLFDGVTEVVRSLAAWPIEADVPAGLYTVDVDTQPPYRSIAGRPLSVLPPRFDRKLVM
jgi:Caspase domain